MGLSFFGKVAVTFVIFLLLALIIGGGAWWMKKNVQPFVPEIRTENWADKVYEEQQQQYPSQLMKDDK